MECLYYTDGLISDRKTLTKLCLLFDEVSTFYLSPSYFLKPLEKRWYSEKEMPFFSKSPCERDLLSSRHLLAHQEFINENQELIGAKILKPIIVNQTPPDWESFEINEKKLMKDGSGLAFGLWGQSIGIVPKEKIYVDSTWFSLYRWQSVAGGLHLALESNKVPISDNDNLSKLAIETVQRFAPTKHLPTIEEISGNVAFHSVSLLIPNFPALEAGEILEVKEKLSDDLSYFRAEIKEIVSQSDEISYDQIESIVLQRVKPRLDDLKLKVKSISGELFRKIAKVFFVGGTATSLLSHFLALPLEAQVAATASFAGKILIDVHESKSKRSEIIQESKNRWLVLLLKMKKLRP